MFHGGHEHSGRFHELVDALDLNDVSVFAWDARGHGHSSGDRGYARHFHDFVRDADLFIRHISETYDIACEDMMFLGHSVGSVILSTWLLDYARPVRGAILGSPAFNVKLYVPLARPALRLWQKIQPDAYVNSYVKPGMLTHDQTEAEARANDPLISPKIAVRVLNSLYRTADRVIESASAINVPVLLLSANRDYVVHQKAQKQFFENLSSTHKEMICLDDFYHEVFHESERHIAVEHARRFITECFQRQYPGEVKTSVSPEHMASIDGSIRANVREYENLTKPLNWHDPERWLFALTRLAFNTLGRLSKGIRIGWRYGFDSGSSLNHVYQNRPQGALLLGKLFDYFYLRTPGWEGIRERAQNLKLVLHDHIEQRLAQQSSVEIVDVAAGPGRYLVETAKKYDGQNVNIVCRDKDVAGLAEGLQLAQRMGTENVRYEQGDAFSAESLQNLEKQPDVVIVSGLYELFEDNNLILQSLQAIYATLKPGGVLIYTNQPFHPQLELIARTLNNRDGQPWIMRPRSQYEINHLVARAGFVPEHTLMDREGIFTVNVAHKV